MLNQPTSDGGHFLHNKSKVRLFITKCYFSPQAPSSIMRFKQFTQNSNQADEKFSHQHHYYGNNKDADQRKKSYQHRVIQFPNSGIVLMSMHRQHQSHLKRSNAIRVKEKNFDILPASVRKSILAFHSASHSCETLPTSQLIQADAYERQLQQDRDRIDTANPEPGFSLCDQIKQGVALHPIGAHDFQCIKHRRRRREEPEESLADILARVLAKRHAVMQQTDDESDMSSIDSQPDHYVVVREEARFDESYMGDDRNAPEVKLDTDTTIKPAGSYYDEGLIDHPNLMDVVSAVDLAHGNGRIELIAHL